MRGVEEDNKFAFRADVGAAEESSQREAGAFEIRLGAQLQFASAKQPRDMRQQFGRFPRLLAGLVPRRHRHFDVGLDDAGKLLQQIFVRKVGGLDVVGGKDLLEVGQMPEDPLAE